jgi:thymidylate synthase (FAD)
MTEVELVAVMGGSEDLIERAYRTCYRSVDSSNKSDAFIVKCIKRGHLSPLEFASAVFKVRCSRAASHQIVRHRIASYAQESQRRTKVPYEYVLPPAFRNASAIDMTGVLDLMHQAYTLYEQLIIDGYAKEDARYVLPTAFMTTIMVGMNFRELRHFFKLRCPPEAQWEIREIAEKMLDKIYRIAPNVFEDMYCRFILKDNVSLWTEAD